MLITLFNSLSSKKESLDLNQEITIYLCGITPYDIPHIGNSRSRIILDVFVRLLESQHLKYKYVTNVTDIDDKIINKSNTEKISIDELVNSSVTKYEQYLDLLGCKIKPIISFATHAIPEMLQLIQALIQNNVAYHAIDGHVYFKVPETLPDFYPSNTANFQENIYLKDKSEDFVLWKPSKLGEPFWDSEYCKGRPGWHTECVALILKHFSYLTIHAGGCDLRFPHHANELLQLKQFNCVPKSWMHIGMLLYNSKKMSKSEGNILRLDSVLEKIPPIIIRLIILSTHYRHPLSWSIDKIKQSISIYRKLKLRLRCLRRVDQCLPSQVLKALSDDLNTPEAIRQLILSPDNELISGMELLGLNDCAEINLSTNLKDIEILFEQYKFCKLNKDYIQSDLLRRKLSEFKISVSEKFWIQELI